MGYYPSGKDEIEEEMRILRNQLEYQYTCKKCYKEHSQTKCPYCKSTSKKDNY